MTKTNISRFLIILIVLSVNALSLKAFTRGPIRYQKVDVPLLTALFEEREAIVYGPDQEITGDIEIPYNVSTTLTNWKVTSIREYAFQNCKLTGIKLSPALRTIGQYAFNNCINLKRVETSKGLKFIENNAFNECRNLETFIFAESIKLIGEHAFRNCEKLKEVILYDEISSIREWAFYNCRSLSTVTLNCPITEISVGCFSFCNSLKEIRLPRTVRKICQSAFEYSGLEVIHIGEYVREIHNLAFASTNLHTIYMYAPTPPQASFIVMHGCPQRITLHIPTNSKDAYASHSYWSQFNIVADL